MVRKLEPGKQFLHYRIDSVLGQGGMGIVYKVFDLKLKRFAALKVLQKNLLDINDKKRFLQEVKAIASLEHPNIVRLYEVEESPTPYFTMEYVEGKTLASFIEENVLDEKILAEIMIKISSGLYHAHARGVIHRDIKPANIMLTAELEPKIMDFGLAKNLKGSGVSQSGVEGTPAYLAPEQLQNHKTDKRVDIYALGITMYEALTGKLPFNETSYVSLFYQIINEEPIPLRQVNPKISPEMEAICLRAMSKIPRNRYANSKYLQQDLQAFLDGSVIFARSKSMLFYQVQKIKHNLKYIFLYASLLSLPLFFIGAPIFEVMKKSFFPEHTISYQELTVFPKKGKLLLEWYTKQENLYAMNIIALYSDRVWVEEEEKPLDEVSRISTIKQQEIPDDLLLYYQELYHHVRNNYIEKKGLLEKLIQAIELIHNAKFKKHIGTPLHQGLITFLEILYTKRNENIENKRIIAEKLTLEYQRLLPIEIKKVALELSVWNEISEGNFENKVKSIMNNWAIVDSTKILEKNSEAIKHIIAQIKKITNFSEIIFAKESIWRILYLLSKLGIVKKETTTLFTLYENAFSYFYFAQEQRNDSWTKEKYFLQAISLKEEAIFYQHLVSFYDEMDMADEVIAFSQKGLELNPNNCLLHFFLAKSYISQGLYDKAQRHLNFIEKHYLGRHMSVVYQQQIRLYILRGSNFLTEKEVKTLEKWAKENKKTNNEYTNSQTQLWQKVYYEHLGQVNKAQSMILDNEETEGYKYRKMQIYHELKMFSHVYEVYEALKNNKAYGDRVQAQKILTQITELEVLGWQLNDNYVVELWLKTNEELAHQFNINTSNSNVVWFRKLTYLQNKGMGHILTDKEIAEYSQIKKLVITKLPSEVEYYYCYHKTMANVANVKGIIHPLAFEHYYKTIQLAPLYEKTLAGYRDKNLGRYFYYNYQNQKGLPLEDKITAAPKARQIASNILQYNPGYGGAQTLLGHYYNGDGVKNSKKSLFYFSQIKESLLSMREKKDYHHDFATAYFQVEDYEKALYYYSKWQVYEPFHVFSYLNPGKCFQKLGKYEEAIANFDKLVTLDDNKDKHREGHNVNSLEHRADAYEEWANSTSDKSSQQKYLENAFNDWEKAQSGSFREMFEKIEAMSRITEKLAELEDEQNKRQKLLERALLYWTDLHSSWKRLVGTYKHVRKKWLEEHKDKVTVEIHRLKEKIEK